MHLVENNLELDKGIEQRALVTLLRCGAEPSLVPKSFRAIRLELSHRRHLDLMRNGARSN